MAKVSTVKVCFLITSDTKLSTDWFIISHTIPKWLGDGELRYHLDLIRC